MHVNFELYRVFYQVAVSRNVSKAAKQLFITQPAVSQAIKQLEDRLGTRLFIRLPRGMSLTGDGRRLFGYVEQAYNLLLSGQRDMSDAASLTGGEVFIAAGDTLCRYYLLPYLERFHEAYPGVKLRITNRTSTETVELLRKGIVDLGIVNMPCEDHGIHIQRVGTITDCFVGGIRYAALPESSGIAEPATVSRMSLSSDRKGLPKSFKPISWETLARFPLLLLERGTNTRNFLDSVFAEKGIHLKPEIELGSVDLLVQFARIGLGISAVIREFVEEEFEEGVLFEIPLDPPLPSRDIGVAYREAAPLSPAASELLALLQESDA